MHCRLRRVGIADLKELKDRIDAFGEILLHACYVDSNACLGQGEYKDSNLEADASAVDLSAPDDLIICCHDGLGNFRAGLG